MKIAILSSINWKTPPNKYGPLELIASYIAEGMVKKGHQVTLYATGNSITKANLKWVCPSPLEENKLLDSRIYQYLHNALPFEDAKNFDIIHNHNDVYPLVFSRLVDTPLLTTIHGYYPGIELIYNKYSDSNFVSISNSAREQLPNLNYISTVYHGIPVNEFDFNNSPDDYFCYLGRITPKKGVHYAIKLAQKMNLKLILAGIVPDDEKIFFEQEIKPNLNDKIQFVGNLGEKKKELLRNARALIHLNTEKEAFGLTLIEAMACGTPVVGMDCGAVKEIIDNNTTGYIVTSIDEAERAIQKIDQIKRTDCRKRVENLFSIEKMLDGYEAVYRKIIKH